MKKIHLIILILIAIIVLGFLFFGQNGNNKQDNQQETKVSNVVDMTNNNNISMPSGNQANLPNGAIPEWAKSLMQIDANSMLSREEKIQQFIVLLRQNNDDAQAVSAILIALTMLNPIEVIDEIIPYLKNSNAIVQSAAIGALNNAALLTPEEHELKQSLAENNQKRIQIAEAINELKAEVAIDENVKQALVSAYAVTNPSLEDTKKMTREILSQNYVTPNEASYIASSILNANDTIELLEILSHKDSNIKDRVISRVGASIVENPAVISILSTQQKFRLESFIRNNPPQSIGENFGYQNDQWKNTLNMLSSNM